MPDEITKPTKQELVEMLNDMNKNIESLPTHAMILPVTHYDLSALLILLHAILKDDNASS